jgi:hypothetical protein
LGSPSLSPGFTELLVFWLFGKFQVAGLVLISFGKEKEVQIIYSYLLPEVVSFFSLLSISMPCTLQQKFKMFIKLTHNVTSSQNKIFTEVIK